MKKIIRIGLVDDDRLIAELLSDFLHGKLNILVELLAYSGNDCIEKLSDIGHKLDILILDLKMEDGNGLQLIEHVREKYPDMRTIVLSSFYKSSLIGFMLKTGVAAFIPKETSKEDLVKVIYEVYEEGHYFARDQIEILRTQITHKTPKLSVKPGSTFSQREQEVLELICSQYTAREIADKLYVTSKTVEAHKSSLLRKTGAKNTAGLIIYAIQNNLIDPNDLIILE